uniref:GDNF family receptor alpha 3 n=1 Tax=Zosterops lateralis melanops TaxID=1220523 RepID=A0A8D2PD01_ZOSLA
LSLSLFFFFFFFLNGASSYLMALPSSDCVVAEQLCLSDSTCNATYRTLENCALAKTRLLSLDHDSRVRCLNAELDLGNSSLLQCKCHRRMKRQEHCLRIFWTVHSSMTDGYFNLEASPYENPANEEHWKTDYNKLAALVSGKNSGDATNPCLKATHVCNLSKKCFRLRTDYASICTKGAGSEDVCDRRKCHRGLRNFFEKVPEDFTKRILFCPCQDEFCGERRRKTIVPDCSFQSNTKPNCLWLLDSCLEDHICKSRLADFQQNCQPVDMSPDGCSLHNHAACLQAYMGMIGTPMTPNFVSNSSVEVSLWCTCENSGNQKEKCDQILGMFESNKCLGKHQSHHREAAQREFKSCGFKILCCTAVLYSSVFFCNVSVISSATYGNSLDLLKELFLYFLATFLLISNTLEAISKHHSNEGHCKNITRGRLDMLYP